MGDARALLSFGVLGAQVVLPAAWAASEDADHGERGDKVVYLGAAAAGSAVGSLLTFRALEGDPPLQGPGGSAGVPGPRVRLALLAGAMLRGSATPVRVPLVSVRF